MNRRDNLSRLVALTDHKKTMTVNPSLEERQAIISMENRIIRLTGTEYYLNSKQALEMIVLNRLVDYSANNYLPVDPKFHSIECEELEKRLVDMLTRFCRNDLWFANMSNPVTVYFRDKTNRLIKALVRAVMFIMREQFLDDILYNPDPYTIYKYFPTIDVSNVPPVLVDGKVSRGGVL